MKKSLIVMAVASMTVSVSQAQQAMKERPSSAVSTQASLSPEVQAERELMKQRQINARLVVEANEAKKAEATQARLASSVTAEERDALITKYEALIRENEGVDGFNRNAYESRIESLRNADIK